MNTAYFDCFAGSGGDMIVGALIDAGADLQTLKAHLGKLELGKVDISAETVHRGGLAGVKFSVTPKERKQPHRHMSDIVELLESADIPDRARTRAKQVFQRLAEAEARVHGIAVDEVHFHEVGAVDSIVDIVGACLALELLQVDKVYCSAIPVGSGTIECQHGSMPAPAPATAQLLVGAKTRQSEMTGEVTTPTAAALLTTLAETFGPMPNMEVTAVGHGAGTREDGPLPNLLRVYIGRPSEEGTADTVVELSANLDDCTGEIIAAAVDKLLAAGCLDVWAAPIVAKKSRPAWILSALCSEADVARAEHVIFTETTTFGIRRRTCTRNKLVRTHETVETRYGPIRVKTGSIAETVVTAQPEFTDCAKAAEAHHVPVREVFSAAQAAYRKGVNK